MEPPEGLIFLLQRYSKSESLIKQIMKYTTIHKNIYE